MQRVNLVQDAMVRRSWRSDSTRDCEWITLDRDYAKFPEVALAGRRLASS